MTIINKTFRNCSSEFLGLAEWCLMAANIAKKKKKNSVCVCAVARGELNVCLFQLAEHLA